MSTCRRTVAGSRAWPSGSAMARSGFPWAGSTASPRRRTRSIWPSAGAAVVRSYCASEADTRGDGPSGRNGAVPPGEQSAAWTKGERDQKPSYRPDLASKHGDRAWALDSPPVAPALDVFARSFAEIGRADHDDLEALGPGFVTSPRPGRDAHRVPLLELDDLVVELHPPAPAQDHVHLLLRLVSVAVRKAIAGRDALVAQAGLLELERLGRQAELEVRRAVEPGPDVLQILLEVPERERHGAILFGSRSGR